VDEPSHADLEAMAWREIDDLPEEIRSKVSNLDVVIADEPPRGKNWLATYQGHSLTQLPRVQTWGWPHKITVYRGPLLRLSGDDPQRLEQEMRHVIRHEIAHYFGISDERLIEIDRY
jgi:predicted Zn-dependent protease with MMP-like domain